MLYIKYIANESEFYVFFKIRILQIMGTTAQNILADTMRFSSPIVFSARIEFTRVLSYHT